MKALNTALSRQKNKLSAPEGFHYLFIVQITDSDAMYLTNNSKAIIYNGHTYNPFPISFGSISEDSKGNLNSITLSVANINRQLSAYLELYDGMRGKKVYIYLCNTINLSSVLDLGTYLITGAVAGAEAVNFTLGHYNFFETTFPKNRYIRGRCRWIFGSTECGYSPAPGDTCNKTFAGNTITTNQGCKYWNNQARFGGFVGIPSGKLYL